VNQSTRSAILIILAALMSGCSFQIQLGGPKPHFERSSAETIYQSLLAADAAQTVNIARRPDCYTEIGLFRNIGGSHPSEGGVAASWAVVATGHSIVSGFLSRQADDSDGKGWRYAYNIWQAVTIADRIQGVYRNHRDGLRPFGSGADPRCVSPSSQPAAPESPRPWL
jgi:hypothetical protein